MRLALELGLRDYVDKNGFREIVVGLSGGIDSALTAALAVEALGAERVHGVSMPSRFSSEGTRGDARAARREPRHRLPRDPDRADRRRLRGRRSAPSFDGRDRDLTEENLQARVRGVLLMALSNKFGWLVVATGNKSELSVGYATLYGDMAGGFALLKDVFKTDVFRLARHLNERAGRELIPQSIIDRAPSAELRDDQLDQDSLPPYPELDRVLEAYVELDRSREELLADGFDPDVVDRALAMIDRAEYKRRQAPPGVKLRPKAFGRDRRTPITNRWRRLGTSSRSASEPAQPLGVRHGGVRRRRRREHEQQRLAEPPLLQAVLRRARGTRRGRPPCRRTRSRAGAARRAIRSSRSAAPAKSPRAQVARARRRPRAPRSSARSPTSSTSNCSAGRASRGVNPASWSSRQKSFRGFAKCAAAAAETRPGLIPQKTTPDPARGRPGRRSRRRSPRDLSAGASTPLRPPGARPDRRPALLLEELDELLSEQPAARTLGLGLPDHGDGRLTVAVQACVALGLAQGPEPRHARNVASGPDGAR